MTTARASRHFDDFDELAFMFRDGWERYNPEQHPLEQGTLLEEIRLDSPRNQPTIFIYCATTLNVPGRTMSRWTSRKARSAAL